MRRWSRSKLGRPAASSATTSPSSAKSPPASGASATAISGYRSVMRAPLRAQSSTRPCSRSASRRTPSHLSSKSQPGPRGTSSTRVGSMRGRLAGWRRTRGSVASRRGVRIRRGMVARCGFDTGGGRALTWLPEGGRMPARSIGSGTISFGLVSIPIRVYVATHSEQLSFNMLHAPCHTRIKQQLYCPHHDKVVERSEIVKGYQFEKDRYVTFTDEEIRALEAEANRAIDIHEFVPLAGVDPIYFEDAHYLGPDKGAEKAYHLLAQAMRDTGKVALAQYVRGGKEHLVLLRPYDGGLVLHTMHYADEVRSLAEVDLGGEPKVRAGELEMARKLVQQLSAKAFRPEQYKDQYRERVEAVVQKKVAGQEVTAAEPEKPKAQVIDLMEALKASLSRTATRAERLAEPEVAGKRRPAALARAHERQGSRRRAHKK